MPIDPQRVKEIFLEAAELPDEAARAAYLDGACQGDAGLRARVEALLHSHDPNGSFLGTPAAVVPGPDPAPTEDLSAYPSSEVSDAPTIGGDTGMSLDELLAFLNPPTRKDALGRIGRYEVLQVLGRGAFGVVFRASDDILQRVVALKVMAPQIAATSPARKRFLREARSSAQVRHENVVQVYEVAEQPLPYLVMEFIPGETLQQKLDRVGPLDVPEVLRIGRQIAEGLAAAHTNDLIHRDVKPANVLLESGPRGHAKITDFGLARAADDASISQSGIVAGTPMYMAPEQAQGQTLDHRADLFSLGSVLYQMVAGRPPFRANTTVAVLRRVAEDTPRAIREIIPETPQWLCDIIAKLHAKNPDERFQSAREVADVLADCEAQLKANAKLKDFSRIPRGKPAPSGKWKWVAAAVLLLPVIALAVTELAGVTHLFRGHQATTDPTQEGWVQLIKGEDLEGWGQIDDPAAGCKFEHRAGVLRLTVPAGDHDLSPLKDFNLRAPRVWEELEGDFTFRVHVSALERLPAKSASRTGFAVAGAGLVVWQDENNFVRFLRAYAPFDEKMPFRVEQHWFQKGVLGGGFGSPDAPWLQIERKGTRFSLRTSPDGRSWMEVGAVDLTIGARLKVGVVAVSTLDRDVTFQFTDRELVGAPSPEAKTTSITKQESLPPTFKNSIGMEFVRVPKGKSWLGGGKDKLGDTEVEIPADFYLGKYEVTQEEWTPVMGENPSWFSRTGSGKDAVKDISDADLKRFPVEMVSWNQCQTFVARLNELEKETGWVYRLPKEVEWEYACRGGPMSDKLDSAFPFYFTRPTNTLLPEQANFGKAKGLNRTRKVGSYEANRLGLFDLHGNVLEWCLDTVDAADGSWVYRGGGWANANARECQAAIRNPYPAPVQSWNLGLRLARVRSGAPSPEVKLPFSDPDRRAAEYVLSVGGSVEVNERPELIWIAADLPPEPFRLTTAYVINDRVTDAGLAKFKDCTNLTNLSLGGPNVSEAGLAHFKDCKDLRLIALSVPAGDAGMVHFTECKNLQALDLRGTRVSDAGLAHFKDCTNLTRLYLPGPNVGDAGLAHFMDCKKLKKLQLQVTQVSDTGLAYLKGMPLEDVRLVPKNFTHQGLAVLREMKYLKTIGVGPDANQVWPAAEFWERYDKGEFK